MDAERVKQLRAQALEQGGSGETQDEAFARLVAAEERERCAQLCENLQSAEEEGWSAAASFLAGEIRRG